MLVVNFADEELFITKDGIKIQPQDRVLTRKLMRQLPGNAQSLQDKLTAAGEGSKVTTMIILVANLLLAVSLQSIFDMIQALQIVILFPLLGVLMPANTSLFFNELTSIAAFDVFETNETCLKLFKLLPREPIS